MISFYANKASGNSSRVEYVLKLLKIPYTYKSIDFKDLKTLSYVKINPAGKVPAIQDGEFTLFESSAINKYLCNKYNGEFLYPYDPEKRALIDSWLDFCALDISIPVGVVVFNRVFAPNLGMSSNEALIQWGLHELTKDLPLLEEQLKKHAYLVGERMSLADIHLLATLQYADAANIDVTAYPHLVNWKNNLRETSFYKEVHQN